MNLGDVYLKAFFVLLLLPSLVAVLSLVVVHKWFKIGWGTILFLAILIAPILGLLLNYQFHAQLFTEWHQRQNPFVPQSGCLSYQPSFFRLYAKYQMTSAEFNNWVTSHPWQLSVCSEPINLVDQQMLGLYDPELVFESPMADNGKQLRCYFKAGVMYISYSSM